MVEGVAFGKSCLQFKATQYIEDLAIRGVLREKDETSSGSHHEDSFPDLPKC